MNQSMISIGSGGFSGKGFLQGTQTKFKFVPKQSSDFIFCTVGEEWGFIGSFVVIGLYLTLILRLLFLAERQRSVFSRIYGYCVASILFIHFFINIGMAIGTSSGYWNTSAIFQLWRQLTLGIYNSAVYIPEA